MNSVNDVAMFIARNVGCIAVHWIKQRVKQFLKCVYVKYTDTDVITDIKVYDAEAANIHVV